MKIVIMVLALILAVTLKGVSNLSKQGKNEDNIGLPEEMVKAGMSKINSNIDGKKIYSLCDLIEYFASKESISPLKLNMLVYYSYAWELVLYERRVSNITFAVNEEGYPVCNELEAQIGSKGDFCMNKLESHIEESAFDEDTRFILDNIWDTYRDMNIIPKKKPAKRLSLSDEQIYSIFGGMYIREMLS